MKWVLKNLELYRDGVLHVCRDVKIRAVNVFIYFLYFIYKRGIYFERKRADTHTHNTYIIRTYRLCRSLGLGHTYYYCWNRSRITVYRSALQCFVFIVRTAVRRRRGCISKTRDFIIFVFAQMSVPRGTRYENKTL